MGMRGGFVHRLSGGEKEDFHLQQLGQRNMALLGQYIRPHLLTLAAAVGAMLLVTASTLVVPYLTKVAIDEYIIPGDFTGLSWLFASLVVIQGIYWWAAYWQAYLSNLLGQRIIYRLRKDVFDKLLSLSMDFYDDEKVGRITSRITHDVDALANLLSAGLVNFANDVLTLVGIVIIMFWLQPLLAVVTLLTVPVVILTMWLLGVKLRSAYQEVRRKAADLTAEVEESVAGIRVIQALSQETTSVGKFSHFNLDNLKANLKAVFLFAMIFPAMSVLATLGTALVLVFGGTLVARGDATLGVLIAFLGYVSRFFGPIRELSQVYNSFQMAGAGAERVFSYLQREPTLSEPASPRKSLPPWQGEVRFEAVSFGYNEREKLLEDFDLIIRPQETVAIVGPTGAGKSTLARLLVRLYDAEEGAIRIDGIDVRELSFEQLRAVVGMVPQNTHLFYGTLAENVAYGRDDVTLEEVDRALKAVHADQVMTGLPQGLKTQVGEGGGKLSGGQKQLIAFARALLANPKVLVLDEATSNVDAHTESLIQRGMDQLMKGRTCIIIAHRFSTLNKAERILVLDSGRIVASGTHEQLMEGSSLYRRLYQQQEKDSA